MVRPTNKVSKESIILEIIGLENISRLNWGEEVEKVKTIITSHMKAYLKIFYPEINHQ